MKKTILVFIVLSVVLSSLSLGSAIVQVRLKLNTDHHGEEVDLSGRTFELYRVAEGDSLLEAEVDVFTELLFASAEQRKNRLGEPVLITTTDETHTLSLSGLTPGYYLVMETQTDQEGYLTVPFITDLNQSIIYPKLFWYDKGCVQVGMLEATTSEPVAGVVWKIVRLADEKREDVLFSNNHQSPDGQTVMISDASGRLQLDGLSPGDYEVIVLEVPEGFSARELVVKFRIEIGAKGCSLVHLLFDKKTEPAESPTQPNQPVLPGTGIRPINWTLPGFLIGLGAYLLISQSAHSNRDRAS